MPRDCLKCPKPELRSEGVEPRMFDQPSPSQAIRHTIAALVFAVAVALAIPGSTLATSFLSSSRPVRQAFPVVPSFRGAAAPLAALGVAAPLTPRGAAVSLTTSGEAAGPAYMSHEVIVGYARGAMASAAVAGQIRPEGAGWWSRFSTPGSRTATEIGRAHV